MTPPGTGIPNWPPSKPLRSALEVWERPDVAEGLAGMIQDALREPAVRAVAQDYLESAVIARLAEVLGGRNATHRAAAASAVLSGVFFARYVLQLQPMASLSPEGIVRAVGPAVDAALWPR